MSKQKYIFQFFGEIEVEASSREKAIDLCTSYNNDKQLEKINQLILENVNFNY